MRTGIALAPLALALALAACGGDGTGDGASSPTPTGSPRPSSTADLTILEPENEATIQGPNVTVRVAVENATILEKATRELRPDTGHIHILLGQETVTLLAGEVFTIEDVEPGEYILRVEFAAADHNPFDPPVIESVRITVT